MLLPQANRCPGHKGGYLEQVIITEKATDQPSIPIHHQAPCLYIITVVARVASHHLIRNVHQTNLILILLKSNSHAQTSNNRHRILLQIHTELPARNISTHTTLLPHMRHLARLSPRRALTFLQL